MITRREAIQKTALLTAALTVGAQLSPAQAQSAAVPTGPFHLDPLPYPFDALEPHIDAQTMQIHHDKHHAAYVANLNKAVADQPDLAKKSAAELITNLTAVPEKIRTAVRNNAGGHVNHTFFWQLMAKNAGGMPKGDLATAIDKKFGGFDKFKTEFSASAMSRFGSGWAWLAVDGKKDLIIESSPNQDSPWMEGRKPILGIDVWEHAYYLKYQNKRADYVAAFFNVINWDFVAEQFKKAM
ncbi:MAG: superoxide dismutase [Opitutaceae bacterium]|nr:superoxide dismutase [Verrucomicrobiales bacterium]